MPESRSPAGVVRRRALKTLEKTLAILLVCALGSSAAAADTLDALAPKSSLSDARTGPLHTVTISTNSLAESLLFYRDGLDLSVEGPLDVSAMERAQQRRLWDLDETLNWDEYRLFRAGVEGTIQIRLLVFDTPLPAIHRSWNALEFGTFSVGFPNLDQTALDSKLRKLGFGALNTLKRYSVPRTDGSLYPIEETIFNGPDFVHAVGINRGDGMSQLGPVNAETGYGGPAYSALVVEDSDAMLDFLVEVLGLELRSDRVWKSSGSDGAMNVPDGTVFRFSIVYSPGSRSQHMLLVDYENVAGIDAGVAPSLPNRGIGLWSFPVRDLNEVLGTAHSKGIDTVAGPLCHRSPTQGEVRIATLRAPNQMLIEVFEEGVDCAAPQAATELPFAIDGWREITASVSDIAAHKSLFLDVAGWEVISEGALTDDELSVWGLPDKVGGTYALLGNPGTDSGYLRLIEFDPPSQEMIRPNAQSWDTGGIFDFNVRVKDGVALQKKLQAQGWQATANPHHFQFGPFEVTEWIARGNDGITIAMIERHKPTLTGWPNLRVMSRTFNATQVVSDLDASLHFYKEVLGFKPYLEHRGASPERGENVLGLPLNVARTHEREVHILHPAGLNEGSVELLYFADVEGRDFADRAVAPHLGLLSLRFPTRNLSALASRLRDAGYAPVQESSRLSMPPYGDAALVSVQAPGGSLLEFFEISDEG